MKVVIMAGGFGTRISEESHLYPKPMIRIGDMPILWHIMKLYSSYGCNDFIICCGYKQNVIKKFFADYHLDRCDITLDLTSDNKMIINNSSLEPWKVTVVDTGLNTMTGGRLKRVRSYIGNETFMLTYGDGVSDVNIDKLLKFHKSHNRLATITAIIPENRFGVEVLSVNEHNLAQPYCNNTENENGWVNGGFMVLEPKVIDYIAGDHIMLENEPLEALAKEGELMSYKHYGFWQCMDTIRDKNLLENLWDTNSAPWKVWED